jgi:hypothetical protein
MMRMDEAVMNNSSEAGDDELFQLRYVYDK